MSTSLSPPQLLEIALEAARAGALIVRNRSADIAQLEWNEKATVDFVTDVDRESETAIAAIVQARAPHARVIGEELSPTAETGSGLAFVVDPIDGTTNFLHGYPEYAVSTGVLQEGDPVAAVVLNVATGELFTAFRGGGTRRNHTPVHVSSIDNPRRALIGTGFPFKHLEHADVYLRQMRRLVQETAGIRRAGSAALDLADVACGRFDGFWEMRLAPWDIAAGVLLVREAGGVVTDLEGAAAQITHTPIVAGNPTMHPWLLATLHDAGGNPSPPTHASGEER